MALLLDTYVVSELRKVAAGKADDRFAAWARKTDIAECWLSVINIQELEIGVCLAERRDEKSGAVLRDWLEQQVLATFRDRILPVDLAVVRQSARYPVPDPAPVRDALIAATAVVHGLVVATRNVADFQRGRVELINPWELR
ncbi:MAG: type II toxin-antitoxin system VapC family toxin [Wenzhouxiangella sp.]|nr:type II toxin-antitoxin system VapC family toxin [Wenzhouxiangella sp.]MCH8479252.1 type II toxin-antitoxin system VapC family toxin [Wenzhouxiangella sp.]